MIGITRRSLLLGGAMLAAGSTIACADETGLASAAASKGLRFGSLARLRPTTFNVGVLTDPAYERIVAESCSLFVTGSLFWKIVSPDPGTADFSASDAAAAWVRSHGMVLRSGGPL